MLRARCCAVLAVFAVLAPTQADADFDPVVIEPAPGREVVGELDLSFCEGLERWDEDKSRVGGRIHRAISSAQKRGWHNQAPLINGLCTYSDDPKFQEQLRYFVQLAVNQSGLSKQGAIESLVARANSDKWKADKEKGCNSIKPPEEASKRDEAETRARRAAVGCSEIAGNESEWRWYVDRTADVQNELDRLYLLMTCLPNDIYSADLMTEFNAGQLTTIGLCGADVRALDPGKVDQATAGMTMPLQVMARERVARARATFDNLERAAKSKLDSDPDYKRLLIDAPQAAWKKWEADYQKHKKAMDATFKFEDQVFGPSRKAYASCPSALEPGVQAYVKANKIRSHADFVNAMSQPIGYALLTALGTCYKVANFTAVGRLMLRTIEKSRLWRGPRVAVRYAMSDAAKQIRADRTRFPVGPGFFRDGVSPLERGDYGRERISDMPEDLGTTTPGIVKTVKKHPKNKTLIVATFQAEDRITSSNRKIRIPPRPTYFYAPMAKGIKPGAFARFGTPGGSENQPGPEQNRTSSRPGWPIEVYKTKQKKTLVNIYGFTP